MSNEYSDRSTLAKFDEYFSEGVVARRMIGNDTVAYTIRGDIKIHTMSADYIESFDPVDHGDCERWNVCVEIDNGAAPNETITIAGYNKFEDAQARARRILKEGYNGLTIYTLYVAQEQL